MHLKLTLCWTCVKEAQCLNKSWCVELEDGSKFELVVINLYIIKSIHKHFVF